MRWDNRGKVKRRWSHFLKWRFRRRRRKHKRPKIEAIGLILARQQLCTCITLLYFSLPSLREHDVKFPIFTFYGGRKQAATNFSLSLSKRECGPQETNSREIRLHLTFSAKRNKRDEVWKKRQFILKVTFSLPSPLSIVKLPAPYDTESAGVDWKGTPGACSRVLCIIPKTPWALRKSKKRTPFVNRLFV